MIRTLVILALIFSAALPVAAPHAAPSDARSVTLADASVAPSGVTLVQPGRIARVRGCATEYSAYRWNGDALGAQHRHGRTVAWHGHSGAVTLRSGIFRNGTREAVLVAWWCS